MYPSLEVRVVYHSLEVRVLYHSLEVRVLYHSLEVRVMYVDVVAQLVEHRPRDPMDAMDRGSNPVPEHTTKL